MALAADKELGTDLVVGKDPGVDPKFDLETDVDPERELNPLLDDEPDVDIDASILNGGWHSEAWGRRVSTS